MIRTVSALAIALSVAAAAPAMAASTYAKTKYPVVMVHGIFGFNKIGPIEYFHGIPADLAANGATTFVTPVSSLNSHEVRGEQMLKQVQDILAITNAGKVNLLGHSQGGPTARYVSATIPNSIASVTTVGGVNKYGSPVADIVLTAKNIVGTKISAGVASIVNVYGIFTGLVAGKEFEQNSLAALDSLSSAGTAKFNSKFPAGIPTTACGEGAYETNGVKNYSFSGTAVLTNPLDPIDALFGVTSLAFIGKTDSQNDGLVGRCASHFGKVLRDNYYMNHVDEVNLMFGLVSIFETNPKAVYRSHLNRLKVAGL